MQIHHEVLEIPTDRPIGIYNVTPRIKNILEKTGIQNGQVIVFSRHTTTAIAINEDEERLLVDIEAYLRKLAPPEDKYLHNDLHLRDVPPDEPINAHSHLMAMTLGTSEVIPIIDGKLSLGTWQSILFLELDGPRKRTLSVQFSGL
jgi:secondary thiamine-phosphate synthase enzyme